jgi:transcriptional regulator with XRE-family HTH domain
MVASLHTKRYELFRGLLAEARRSQGLTQVELATKLKVNQSFVSKYENGERRLDVTEFIDIANALNIDAYELLNTYTKKSVTL